MRVIIYNCLQFFFLITTKNFQFRQEHQCPNECEEQGICKIVIEPTAVEVKYENAHESFMYTKVQVI